MMLDTESTSSVQVNKGSKPHSVSYPLASYLRFCPGGISYSSNSRVTEEDDGFVGSDDSETNYYFHINSIAKPASLIQAAKDADDRLRQYSLLYSQNTKSCRYYPSLALLSEAVFGRLTGCSPDRARQWADAMVCQYASTTKNETLPMTEDDILNAKPAACVNVSGDLTTVSLLKKILQEGEQRRSEAERQSEETKDSINNRVGRPRPCGYVFKRGDIAWNCRTCQTDPTCVICDDCFRDSDHEGHEVYFHRTNPGGCCDCGDAEAWAPSGCCHRHKPIVAISSSTRCIAVDDPMEAVRASEAGLSVASEVLEDESTALPAALIVALGTIIGAAVNCLQEAVDGSGVGSDAVQWTKRWADEAARVANNAPNNEDYYLHSNRNRDSFSLNIETQSNEQLPFRTVQTFLTQGQVLPENYKLHLRLHNDDVHTFEEVIEALHDPRNQSRVRNSSTTLESGANQSLVERRENAHEMTHLVDSDGQVTVITYNTIAGAVRGFQRLKSKGLQCAVVSTAQVQLELRARVLCQWLSDIAAAHPAAQALVVQALVQTDEDFELAGIPTWHAPRMIPLWAAVTPSLNEGEQCRIRFRAFPPDDINSYITREESELLHGIALTITPTYPVNNNSSNVFIELTGTVSDFYSDVPYRLPSFRFRKSPHSIWGTLPGQYTDPLPLTSKHPLLERLVFMLQQQKNEPARVLQTRLVESVYAVDTDLRKQQEGEKITVSVFPHKLPGLHMVSGVGTVRASNLDIARRPPTPSPMDWRHLLATCSFRAPLSPILLLLLLDPYPTKQLRSVIHSIFLSLLTNGRFKARFAGALAVAYRPLSTLFCAGVGTEADTPLHFTVQIFTAGSLVRALGHGPATERLLLSDKLHNQSHSHIATPASTIGVFLAPIAHIIVRCIHTNLLGATKDVAMILNNTATGANDEQEDSLASSQGNPALLPALTYVAGEHPLLTLLPAAPDDGFLDSRSTRHKRLPHLLRDLDYVIETPGTAIRLLLPNRFPVYPGPATLSHRGEDCLPFAAVFSRMLRLAQGMDPQKRKISGGHVEYELNRWFEAFGLSLNFGGTRDALTESPLSFNPTADGNGYSNDADQLLKLLKQHLNSVREAMGNLFASLLRELKFWLYREGLLETGLPVPSGGQLGMELAQQEALQRSTLHVSSAQVSSNNELPIALSCATGVKMTEAQLTLIENAMKVEAAQRLQHQNPHLILQVFPSIATRPVIVDLLRVPHSPLAGDSLSFHLPLHRAIAKAVRSVCSCIISENVREANSSQWWKIPILDDGSVSTQSGVVADQSVTNAIQHPLLLLIRPTLRSSNCRVVWSAGPDCTPQEAQKRRARSRTVSANIAVAKIIHSLADHPIRCLAAAQQIERHLWARNGASVVGMAMNYASVPLCRSFRDLDLLLVQLSASGMNCGLGARRVFSLLLNRFSMEGYLCDPERRSHLTSSTGSAGAYGNPLSVWVNPPRLQDPDHAVILSESFFSTLCVLVTELPPPPPNSPKDDSSLKQSIRRELLHALAAEARSHSEAMTAASCGVSRREESEGLSGGGIGASLFKDAFSSVLREIGKQKNPGSSRASSGPPLFELKPDFCNEYDPSFFHLRRNEHQHAMDVIARLRKQKLSNDKETAESYCFPLVCPPPKVHPRFLPCRLLLHVDAMDAALRRSLLFALTNGSWLPPSEPVTPTHENNDKISSTEIDTSSVTSPNLTISSAGDVPVTTFNRRANQTPGSTGFLRRSSTDSDIQFSSEAVAASSVSFLEVLQLLTLQVHTLEECASLHRTLSDLDDEAKLLSAGLSINSYLGRLIRVPESLIDVWALRPYPSGPLKSKGSGEFRGSTFGLLIALYEHRSDHGAILDSEGKGEGYGQTEDGHGGARTLASSGLKWLLRFVHALVEGALSVGVAMKCATMGTPFRKSVATSSTVSDSACGTIKDDIRLSIKEMLQDLPELWPKLQKNIDSPEKVSDKSNEARKAAQLRVMTMMKQKQAAFAATIAPSDATTETKLDDKVSESDLCIICRCDDADGENNGPLGYLGHVQRSRVAQIRTCREAYDSDESNDGLIHYYKVVGHMGCQLRETEAMDSKPLVCLPKGSTVKVKKAHISPKYDILSRRVFVEAISIDPVTTEETMAKGWASVQSSHGYIILSPLISPCYLNTRWGTTRPIIKQCGHAAHTKCVEAHTLSLHQRAAGDQPYDGRFAANISDGEFLCPLCKQLSNVLIPRDNSLSTALQPTDGMEIESNERNTHADRSLRLYVDGSFFVSRDLTPLVQSSLEDFGSNLYNAMNVSWDRDSTNRRKHQQNWHPAILKWDYEEGDDVITNEHPGIKNLLRLLRQQLISWAAVGHSACSLELGTRGVEQMLPFGVVSETSDPWPDFSKSSRDNHPMLLELKRSLTASSGLLEVLTSRMGKQLGSASSAESQRPVVASCLADILEGYSWMEITPSSQITHSSAYLAIWSSLTALVASIPCHVARDDTIPPKCEARSTASTMWAVKGLGSDAVSKSDPPTPFAISRLHASVQSGHVAVPQGWGTLLPFVDDSADPSIRTPFRLGIACAFLYIPLLAWDLSTFSSAILSACLLNDVGHLPASEDILEIAQVLLSARLVQAIIAPDGFEIPDDMELDDESVWSEQELSNEGSALILLIGHCRHMVSNKVLAVPTQLLGEKMEKSSASILAGLGRAILPFARCLILQLRSFTAIVRERQIACGMKSQICNADEVLESLLCSSELMSLEDGFQVSKDSICPRPSLLADVSTKWFGLVNKWIIATIALEIHQGLVARNTSPKMLASVDAMDVSGHPSGMVGLSSNSDESSPSNESIESSGQAGLAMDIDLTRTNDIDRVISARSFPGDDDSDDESEQVEINEGEEMVGFADHNGSFGVHASASGNMDVAYSSDNSSCDTDGDSDNQDFKFANLSRSAVIPHQPSLLGIGSLSPGTRDDTSEKVSEHGAVSDLSHLGLLHRKEKSIFCLIRLPKSFVELYNVVNKVKGRDETLTVNENDDGGSSETAICLLTGAVMRSGTSRRQFTRSSSRPPGACTLHARKSASGIGIFFLVQKCTVLLMHNNKSAYSPSLYVDEHGEEDPQLRRGRPLYLNEGRYRALEMLWRNQGIPGEVAQIRSTSDRVIRDNWY